jgi:integrase
MKLCSHLKLSRHGIYYFRCIIPKALRPLYDGKTEFKYSLNTRCPVTAKRESYILSAKTAHLFDKAKKTMSWHDLKDFDPKDMSTWPTQNDKLRNYEIVESNGEFRIKVDPSIPNDHKYALEALGMLKTSAPPRATQSQSQAIKLSVAIKKYLDIRDADAPNAKTMIDMRGILKRFLTWTNAPHDPPVDAINKKMMGDYLHHLITTGVNQKKNKKGLSKTTANKHLSFLNGLFVKLQEWGEIPPNTPLPTEGISAFAKGEKKKATKNNAYLPFTSNELSQIFNPATINKLKKPHEFWVTILGLYSGARINELSQPYLDDFTCENGLWRLHIHDEQNNRTKTESSERYLPLHPDLIALGLLDYLEDVREVSPEGRIFPYLLESSLNGFGDVPSEAFGRYLDKLKIDSAKKVFHSFRHTINHHLIGKSVPQSDREELLGHAPDGTNVEHYGRTKTAEELWKDVVCKISFKQISDNIETLRYTKGKFSQVLRKEMARRNRQQKNSQAKKARLELATRKEKLIKELNA